MVSPYMAREVQSLSSVCNPGAAAGAQESGQTTATDRYRRCFENCPDAILLVDPLRRQVLDCNPAMRPFCSDGDGQIAGQPLRQLGLAAEASRWLEELMATDPLTLVGSPALRRLRWRHRNGLWLAGTGSAHVFVADDRPILQLSFRPDRTSAAEDPACEARLVKATLDGAVASLTALIRARDPYTQEHQERVAALCRAIATRMDLDADRIAGLDVAALLHDSGKMSIGLELLTKPTALKPEEYQLIKTHVQTSYEVLKPIPFAWPVATIVHQHHERLDGSGYPLGLRGDQILLEAKILAVADTVESMATDRPYRRGKGIDVALEQIENHRGSLYGAEVVDACLKLFREENYRLPLNGEAKQPS